MTASRIIVPGATTAITRRTTLRKAFLAPWHPGVRQAWLYALADAQRRTEVAVHSTTLVITHHHTEVTPKKDNLPVFVKYLHHDTSCALNTLLARERYDQPGELFDDRSAHLMRLCDAPAQSTQLIYDYLNPFAAGLVDRPEHMPDHCFDFSLWKRGYIEVRRPDFYFGDNRPEVQRLELTPPPLLYQAFGGDMDALIYHMERMANDAMRMMRPHQGPRLRARRLERMHPWSEPRTLRETRGQRVPSFRIGARGIVGQQMHIEAAQETTAFRCAQREARTAWAEGQREVVFPYGTYQMRVLHNARVEEPPELGGGIVCRPGPSLADVQAGLERERGLGSRTDTPRHLELCDQTREAFRQEARELCEHASDGMDFRAPEVTVRSGAAVTAADRGNPDENDTATQPVVVRHRFARTRPGADHGAPRVVTLRDRRRGRPRSSRHGTDPPA